MEPLGLMEESNAFQYAILSTRVSQVLNKLQKKKSVTELEYLALRRGAALLKQVIEGSILISQKGAMNGFFPSQEGLSAYGHALSAIDKLGMIKGQDFTDLFMRLYDQLVTISSKQPAEEGVVPILVSFFNMLSNLFSADIKKESFYKTKDPSTATGFQLAKHHAYA